MSDTSERKVQQPSGVPSTTPSADTDGGTGAPAPATFTMCARCTPLPPPATSRTFTPCQLRALVGSGALLLHSGNTVYDVTKFARFHPGGSDSIRRAAVAGRDCTVDLQFHSHGAQSKWAANAVGRLVPCGQSGGWGLGNCAIS